MANPGEIYWTEHNTVYVTTNLDTRLATLAHIDESVSYFTNKFGKLHEKHFPQFGEVNVALKVKRRDDYYDLCGHTSMRMAFKGFGDDDWFMYAHVERVEKPELVDVDGCTERLTIQEGFESKKRKTEHLDGNKSPNKPKTTVNESLATDIQDIEKGGGTSLALNAAENQLEAGNGLMTGPTTEKKRKRKKSSKDDIVQSIEATGNLDHVDATSKSLASLESGKLANPLAKAIQRENGMGENVDDDAENLLGASSSFETQLVDKRTKKLKIQSSDGKNSSKKLKTSVNESLAADIQDIGKGGGSSLALNAAENQLEAGNGLMTSPSTKKKSKRKKSSKDDIVQSIKATGNLDPVDATSESLAASERGNLANPLAKAIQRENKMGENIDDGAEDQLGLVAV